MSDKTPAGKKKTAKSSSKKSSRKSGNSSPKSAKKSTDPASPVDLDPPPKVYLSSKICLTHKKELRFYSDAHEELLCEDCASGPTRYPSKIVSVNEAFRVRLSGLYNILNNFILPKKAQLLEQKHRVETCLNSVKLYKVEIEKDMKAEFSAMNERLNFSYGTKQAVLQHDLEELQVDLDRLLHIINIIESSSSDQISFLQRSGDLRSLLELSSSKPFKVNVDVGVKDLPKELSKIREISEDFQAAKNVIKIKDELIWKLIHEKPSTEEIQEAKERELAEWARLAEKYAQELKKFHVHCEFCACPLNENTVNANCLKNIRPDPKGINKMQGTGRHFFSNKPSISGSSNSPGTKESELKVQDIAKVVRQKNIPLHRIFIKSDTSQSGVVNLVDLADILSDALELSKTQTTDFAIKLDIKHKGFIKYDKLIASISVEIIKYNMKSILDSFRLADEEVFGVISQSTFLNILSDNGVLIENARVLSIEIDQSGDVEYLSFINSIAKMRR